MTDVTQVRLCDEDLVGIAAMDGADVSVITARSMFRIASVRLDRDDRVAGATVVASGACLDFALSVAPGARVAGDSPATLTIARADILRLREAAGEVAGTGPRRAASGLVGDALYGLTEGEDAP